MKDQGKKLKALCFGSTGLIGSHLVEELSRHPAIAQVICPVRSEGPSGSVSYEQEELEEAQFADSSRARTLAPVQGTTSEGAKVQVVPVHFDGLYQDQQKLFQGVDLVFCTLGTTRKKAKGRENFRKVDYTYPLTIGKLCALWGVGRYLLVTAVGANAKSPFFYSRVKGELEEDLQTLPLKELHIFRPSLLLGERNEKRLFESLAQKLAPLLVRFLKGDYLKYRPIAAEQVAKRMVQVALGQGLRQELPGPTGSTISQSQTAMSSKTGQRPGLVSIYQGVELFF